MLLLWGISLGNGVSAAETAPIQTTVTEEQKKDEPSRTTRIVGFLAIFTVACGVTAYLVMRPSLKRLKEAKQQTVQTEIDNSKTE